ncbi:MAG TPA: hypothetical protein VEZ90_07700, partial [Blastocatellia bacterium]|nr:hypothetical protein [Blastocatellia bacterium]
MGEKRPQEKKSEVKQKETGKRRAPKLDRSTPIIVVNNGALDMVSDAQMRTLIAGIQAQITEDFLPAWGLKARLVFGAKVDVPHMEVDIRDYADKQGDMGYHFRDDGYPQAFVFASESMANGAGIKGLSTTLSHEILEMIADPGVNLSATQPPRNARGKTRSFAYEVCDPVED